jgi:hypothetical protein
MSREVSRQYHEALLDPEREHPGLLTCRNTGVTECLRGDTLHTHTAERELRCLFGLL